MFDLFLRSFSAAAEIATPFFNFIGGTGVVIGVIISCMVLIRIGMMLHGSGAKSDRRSSNSN